LKQKGTSLLDEDSYHVSIQISHDSSQGYDQTFGVVHGGVPTSSRTEFTDLSADGFSDTTTGEWMWLNPSGTNHGFDKEGNPISGHCVLVNSEGLSYTHARIVEIRNSNTRKIIGRFQLPDKITVY
jgi:hypothetical protein